MLNVMLFVMFAMVAAMFVHTFSNFFMGVYSVVVAKLAAPVRKSKTAVKNAEQSVLAELTTIEHFVGGLVAKVVALFKGKKL